jgi:hypothetical protein
MNGNFLSVCELYHQGNSRTLLSFWHCDVRHSHLCPGGAIVSQPQIKFLFEGVSPMAGPSSIVNGNGMLGSRLWARVEDEEPKAPVCSALEGGAPCAAEAFVRIWRSAGSDDISNLCLSHAQREKAIFLVEPICRNDFQSGEYQSLLEKSALGREVETRELTGVSHVTD